LKVVTAHLKLSLLAAKKNGEVVECMNVIELQHVECVEAEQSEMADDQSRMHCSN
jgi:hypothetical protein